MQQQGPPANFLDFGVGWQVRVEIKKDLLTNDRVDIYAPLDCKFSSHNGIISPHKGGFFIYVPDGEHPKLPQLAVRRLGDEVSKTDPVDLPPRGGQNTYRLKITGSEGEEDILPAVEIRWEIGHPSKY